MTNLPKSLQRFKHKLVDYENDTAQDNGHWIYYASGWKSGNDALGACHLDHEDTVGELVRCAREALPCDCPECVADLAKQRENS